MNAAELTIALIEHDSRNPSLVPGAPGEATVAQFLANLLTEWQFDVTLSDVVPGRPNVVARAGKKNGRSIMLNGHLDVVGIDGMTHPPFQPIQRDGRIYGRGSADMKGGVAAMCVAARDAMRAGLDGEVIIAAVIDEEYGSLGTQALIDGGIRADAAIVTEPTRLTIAPAHRGFVWADIDVRGRAAHGSRYDLGVDAITNAALILAELDLLQRNTFATVSHPLLGRPSLHASTIQGGTGLSTYPDRCLIAIERRTIPGEDEATVRREIDAACTAVRQRIGTLDVNVTITGAQGPSEVAADAEIVRALSGALRHEGASIAIEGMRAWTDCAILNAAGIPAICFGPGDLSLAHATEEYVPVQELETAARVLRQLVTSWCNTSRSPSH